MDEKVATNPSSRSIIQRNTNHPFEPKTSAGLQEKRDLHFLVTHWLSHYREDERLRNEDDVEVGNKQEIVDRIHDLAGSLSEEFAKLGVYGKVLENPLSANNLNSFRPVSYNDIARKWAHLSPSQLELIVRSSAKTSKDALNAIKSQEAQPISVLRAAYENYLDVLPTDTCKIPNHEEQTSILQLPTLYSSDMYLTRKKLLAQKFYENSETKRNTITPSANEGLKSDSSKIVLLAADASRKELALRDKIYEKETLMKTIKNSLSTQRRLNRLLIVKMNNDYNNKGAAQDLDLNQQKQHEYERVISQLSRNIIDVEETTKNLRVEYKFATKQALDLRRLAAQISCSSYDPYSTSPPSMIPTGTLPYSTSYIIEKYHSTSYRPSFIQSITDRQYTGGGKDMSRRKSNIIGKGAFDRSLKNSVYKSFLSERMSFSVTINCHLVYPVYCLCFDKTGRYFVTGADDHLVKLFYIGGAVSYKSSMRKTSQYDLNSRGAVLVSTLRGHAGVVTDIDISADNALLATASEDGSCRIWGLYDGCPVAVLRGHVGGANMVSWSTLTPFRLVTSSMDGLARMWDIRDAALKRYTYIIGKRSDYLFPKLIFTSPAQKSASKIISNDEEEGNLSMDEDFLASNSTITYPSLPPIPQRVNENRVGSNNIGGSHGDNLVPPLPLGEVPPVQANNELTSAQAVIAANREDRCDEGVLLLSKLKHGEVLMAGAHEHQGPDTRSRRKTVKVICLARCPVGGHFATGSDDGLGRIWRDSEDIRVEELDRKRSCDQLCRPQTSEPLTRNYITDEINQMEVTPSTNRLLATLAGHLNAITDLAYSHGGDRILTASQKDGVVRIWAWGRESRLNFKTKQRFKSQKSKNGRFANLTQILIRLTGFSTTKQVGTGMAQSRRRGASRTNANLTNQNLNAQCDVAVWSSNDETVITSQTVLAKANSNEIVPGSHVIYVWDSFTGKCLLGIFGSHNSPCPVLAAHPFDSSILASGGADGCLHLWDLTSGSSFFSHKNLLKYGPCDTGSRGKSCGFLDGSFSPDGLTLVLTDDAGRITIFDSNKSTKFTGTSSEKKSSSSTTSVSSMNFTQDGFLLNGDMAIQDVSYDLQGEAYHWMREQYFANDYYDIDYDIHGYAVERGSRAPPHLAPRASRCNHTGTAVPDQINVRFGGLKGPLPISESDCRWRRDQIRSQKEFLIQNNCEALNRNVMGKKAVSIAQSGIATHKIYFASGGEESSTNLTSTIVQQSFIENAPQPVRPPVRPSARPPASSLSSNYRYLDFEDLPEIDDPDEDADEDFVFSSSRPLIHETSSDDDDSDIDVNDDTSNSSTGRNSGLSRESSKVDLGSPRSSSRKARKSRRRIRNRTQEEQAKFEEVIASQASRTSIKRIATRRRSYDVYSDSDTDPHEEFLSRNTTCSPSDPFYRDYVHLGHFWKMPRNSVVKRDWLGRDESKSGFFGYKPYSPQVGDSVVYIPRAHYDTLQSFVGSEEAPWKSFPRNRSWPVVHCVIQSIRYRFPFENYFRKCRHRPSCASVVAIAMLRVMGIPKVCQRDLPWLDPDFVSVETLKTRSSNFVDFEVSIFQNDELEFLIPLQLYQFRLKNLEKAIRENDDNPIGIELSSYYTEDNGHDDCNMILGNCQVMKIIYNDDNQEPHFPSSGYKSIEVKWENSETDWLSSWEVNVPGKEIANDKFPALTENEKSKYIKVLDELEKDSDLCANFLDMPDCSRYVDYLERVEVPMYLSLIRKRIESYYTNKLSLYEDINLIVVNCCKYNKEDADIVEAAKLLKTTFHALAERITSEMENDENMSILVTSRQKNRSSISPDNVSNIVSAPSTLETLPVPITSADTNRNLDDARATSTRKARAYTGRAAKSAQEMNSNNKLTRTKSEDNTSLVCILQQSISENSDVEVTSHNLPQSDNNEDYQPDLSKPEFSTSIVSRLRPRRKAETPPSSDSETDEDDFEGVVTNQVVARKVELKAADTAVGDDSSTPTRRISARVKARKELSSEKNLDREKDFFSDVDLESNKNVPVRLKKTGMHEKLRSYVSNDEYEENAKSNKYASKTPKPRRRKRVYSSDSFSSIESISPKQNLRSRSNARNSLSSINSLSQNALQNEDDTKLNANHRSTRSSNRALKSRIAETNESDDNEYSSDDYKPAATVKRKAQTSKRTNKKAKLKITADEFYFPNVKNWPAIEKDMVQTVAYSIMEEMNKLDKDNIFTYPVAEAYPELASKYVRIINNPIDFRTIYEEKIQSYRMISELQIDLILAFKNCCIFNGEKSSLWQYAVSLWKRLTDVFREVCEKENVILPRRY